MLQSMNTGQNRRTLADSWKYDLFSCMIPTTPLKENAVWARWDVYRSFGSQIWVVVQNMFGN